MPLDKAKEDAQWDVWLMEAVRKIRTQKQRPGLDRIYNAVRLLAEKQELAEHSQKSPIAPIYHVQVNQIKIEQVQRHLDRSVKAGLLLKVYSKGQATYKAVEKSERTLNLSTATEANGGNGELSKCVLKVIRELSECDAPVPTSSSVTVSSLVGNKQPKPGYTFDTIEEYVRHSHVIIYPDECPPRFLSNLVRHALTKELAKGKVELVAGEFYRIPAAAMAMAASSLGMGSGSSSSSSSVSSPAGVGSTTKVKTSTSNPTTSSALSLSSNSNSSWSSTASSSAAPSNAPTTFSEISASVNSKVKSAPGASHGTTGMTTASTSTPTPTLIKKDNSGGVGGASSAKLKSKDKDNSPSSSPRGNLPGELSEAAELALVTEQTARAVQLVMKDRRPGEKPKKVSPPPTTSAEKKMGLSPTPIAEVKPGTTNLSSNSSSDEDIAKKASATPAQTQPTKSGNGNGNGTAVIKLMVPSFPGRNGNNGNGKSSSSNAGSGTVSKTVQEKGLLVSQSQPDKNPKTSAGNITGNISSSQQSTPVPVPTLPDSPSNSPKGGGPTPCNPVSSVCSIATAIMNKPILTTKEYLQLRQSRMEEFIKLTTPTTPTATPVTPSGSESERSRNPSSTSKESSSSDGDGPLEGNRNRHCMICVTPKIVKAIQKDLRYIEMVQLYWTLLDIDVKPEDCAGADLCWSCFRDLEKLKEANEVMSCLEVKFAKMRLQLLRDMLVRLTWEMSEGSENEGGGGDGAGREDQKDPEVADLKKKLKAELLERHGHGDFLAALDAKEAELDQKVAGYTVEAMMMD